MPATAPGRIRAYAVLAAGTLAGGMVGAAFDQVTLALSPEYFVTGKGLDPTSGLGVQAAWLGFRAALPLGALVTGVGAWCAATSARFSWKRWLGTIAAVVAAALPACAMLVAAVDPFDVRALHPPDAAGTGTRFLLTWGLHLGAYVGVLLGVAIATRGARD